MADTGRHDGDHTPVLLATSSVDGISPVVIWGDPVTHRLLTTSTGGGNIFVYNEVVSGSGTSWTLANTPVLGFQAIYANGQRLIPTVDYSITGAAITTVDSWATGTVLADYQH